MQQNNKLQNSIFKSSGIIGLVQIFKISSKLIQGKFLAFFLGPSGFGIWSLYNYFVTLVSSFSTFGLDQAVVRETSRCSSNIELSKLLWSFDRLLLFFSFFFSILLSFFSRDIASSLLGDASLYWGICLASIAVFMNTNSFGNIAVLNGLRNLRYLAISQIIGYLGGVIFSVFFVLLLGKSGIPFFVVFTYIVLFVFTCYFVRKERRNRCLEKCVPTRKEFFNIVKRLLYVGLGVAYSAAVVAISIYLVQIYIRKNFGIEWVAYYNTSDVITNVYVGILISAMSIDFLPRISQSIEDKSKSIKLLNAQLEVGVLLSSVGVIGILIFSSSIIFVLYSSKFMPAKEIMQWQILTVILRVVTFPLGYILIAKKEMKKYMCVQTLLWGGSYLVLLLLAPILKTDALGLHFLIIYVLYSLVLFYLTKQYLVFSKLLKKLLIISIFYLLTIWFLNKMLDSNLLLFFEIVSYFFYCRYMYRILLNKMGIDFLKIIRNRIKKII